MRRATWMLVMIGSMAGCVEMEGDPQGGDAVSEDEEELGLVTLLAWDQGMPTAIRNDASSLFWINTLGRQVMRMPRSGGTPKQLRGTYGIPAALAIDSSSVYWSECAGPLGCVLFQMGKDGTGVKQLALEAFNQLAAITTDSSYVYWTAGTNVRRVAKGGGTPVTIMVTPHVYTPSIAVDAKFVYVGDNTSNAVYRAPKQGGGRQLLANGPAMALQVTTSEVCFAGSYSGAVSGSVTCTDKSGNTLLSQSQVGDGPRDLDLDAGTLYWTRPNSGSLVADKNGNIWVAAVSQPNTSSPWNLTVTHNSAGKGVIYYTDRVGGTINRVLAPF